MRAAPAVSCAKWTKENAHEHTGSAEAIRHSLRNGFTAYFELSPAIGLSCHRRLTVHGASARSGSRTSARLDAGIEASGPHDFTVRFRSFVSAFCDRSRAVKPALPSRCAPDTVASIASRTALRDDRDTPLLRRRMGELIKLICPTG